MVHDWEGAGRSAVLIVAHIMKTRQITYDAAVEIVRKTRPGISIEDAYKVQLLQLEQDLHLRAAKSQTTATDQAHSAGADFSDYDSDMDDTEAFDEIVEDSSSSDGFLDAFGSDEDKEDEVENEYYDDDDGSHFWGYEYESYDDEESESSTSVVSDTFDSDEDHYEEADDDGSHFWGDESYDDEEEEESSSLSESGSSSDEYWWGHVVDHDIEDEDAFDEDEEDDDVSRFVYFEDEDDVNFVSHQRDQQ